MKPFKQICIIITISFCSCHSGQLNELLQQTDRLIENNPDSALVLLSSYPHSETLNQADFAAYQLMYTKAKDKCYMDLSRDTTLILKSLVYYKQHGNASQKGWSNYYAGRVYEEAGKLFESGLYFLKAAEYAGEIPDPLLGMMANYYLGELHDKQYAFDKSLEAYKTSYAIYSQTSEEKYTGTLLHAIGSEFGINGNRDSAYFYLDSALKIACERNDTIEMAAIYNDIGLYLREDSLYPKAKYYLLQSLSFNTDSSWMAIRKIALAEIYVYLSELDSARFLLDDVKSIVETSDDVELQAIYYSALAKTEASNKNYAAAYLNQKQYVICVDSVYQLQRKSSLAETEQVYNYMKYQEENVKLYAIQHKAIIVSIIVVGIFLIIIVAIIGTKRKKKRELSNAEETVDTLRKMEKENQALSGCTEDEKDKMVKKSLLMQLNITKVLSQLNEKSEKDQDFLEKFNRLFYGEQRANEVNWDDFYMLINLLYNGFAENMQKAYVGILKEKEIQLCCLLKANMDTTEIACVMGQSINTVRTRKTQIRKNIKAPDAADIVAFIEEKLRNKR
ncbi:hypothetical protein [uncultured Parabacteroides sp.]|jgi:DNA-binding CsgD family transcriptional regulator/tetratricopeptide (TPR) repeat protein|uniref:helix-turn-helix transcriptional regulator n=1 Tax=uncultured Parabacteroides sp. TaxID=512312 RepID=UPI0025E26944|nr:hypothetical protein [uncultured Parabacteroides sp.]